MLNKKITAIVAGIIAFIFIAVFVISYLAPFIATADTLQDEIKTKQTEKATIQGKIDTAKQEIDGQIGVLQSEINGLQGEIDECDAKISEAERKIAECEAKEKKQYQNMKTRLRVMYEDNNTSYITMIFGGDTLNDILSYIEIIKQIIEHDNNLYTRIINTKNEIKTLKSEVEGEKEKIVAKKAIVDGKKAELDGKVADMNVTISQINGDIETLRIAYDEAEKEEAALKKRLQTELSGSTTTASFDGGTFAWPTPGYGAITSQYGGRMHPTLKVYKVHTGLDIGAPMGATVVAGDDGTVVKAEYNVAYGNYIVINHGNGYSTLYAHNSVLYVSKGQFVTRGQTIAKVGSTGYSTGPHCHFEVLINGQHTNPLPYLN